MKKVKKNVRKRRNPDQQQSIINIKIKLYIDWLIQAVINNSLKIFSTALIIKNIGFGKCDDCGLKYYDCACEGSREISGYVCEQCYQNYCLCDYNIQTEKDLQNAVLNEILKLNSEEILYFHQHLIKKINLYKKHEFKQNDITPLKNLLEKFEIMLKQRKNPMQKLKSNLFGFFKSSDNDIVYISSNKKIYLFIPRYSSFIESTQKYNEFVNLMNTYGYRKISADEKLRTAVKKIDLPGYARSGMVLVNPKKTSRKNPYVIGNKYEQSILESYALVDKIRNEIRQTNCKEIVNLNLEKLDKTLDEIWDETKFDDPNVPWDGFARHAKNLIREWISTMFHVKMEKCIGSAAGRQYGVSKRSKELMLKEVDMERRFRGLVANMRGDAGIFLSGFTQPKDKSKKRYLS